RGDGEALGPELTGRAETDACARSVWGRGRAYDGDGVRCALAGSVDCTSTMLVAFTRADRLIRKIRGVHRCRHTVSRKSQWQMLEHRGRTSFALRNSARGAPVVSPELHATILRRRQDADEYELYLAALEWDLIDPIVIETSAAFKSE